MLKASLSPLISAPGRRTYFGGAKRVRSSAGLADSAGSQVLRSQPGALRDPRQHTRPDLLVLVKGKHEIGPPCERERPVGARLPLHNPPDPQEGCQHPSSTGARPRAHAAAKEMLRS